MAVWGEGMSQFYAKAEDEERRAIASPVAACGLVERAHTRLVGDIDPNLTIRGPYRAKTARGVCALRSHTALRRISVISNPRLRHKIG